MLFSSSRWQTNETELLVLVTPSMIDPNAPPPSRVLKLKPDTTLPARDAIEKKLTTPRKP
jgi:Flp pilus assembly secretin CpaC